MSETPDPAEPENRSYDTQKSVYSILDAAYRQLKPGGLKSITFSVRYPYFKDGFSIYSRVGEFSFQPLLYGFFKDDVLVKRPNSYEGVAAWNGASNAADEADQHPMLQNFITREKIASVAWRIHWVGPRPEAAVFFNFVDAGHKFDEAELGVINDTFTKLSGTLFDIWAHLLREQMLFLPRLLHLLDIGDSITQEKAPLEKADLTVALTRLLTAALLTVDMNSNPDINKGDASLALFSVVNKPGRSIHMEAAINFPEAFAERFRVLSTDEQSGSSSQLVVHRKGPISFNLEDRSDNELLENFPDSYQRTREQIVCALNVPMIAQGGEAIGMMSLESATQIAAFRRPIAIRLLQLTASLAAGVVITWHNARLKERSQRLASIQAHDLAGDILTAIRSQSQLIRDYRGPAQNFQTYAAERTHDIEALARYLRHSVDAFKTFATPHDFAGFQEQPQVAANLEVVVDVDVSELLKEASRITELTTAKGEIEITCTGFDGKNPPLRGVRRRLLVAIVNLLRNSRKHCPEEFLARTISCNAKHYQDKVTITIQDWGGDIDSTRLKELFSRVVRPLGEGSGHGCFITAAIVRDHAGTVHDPRRRLSDDGTPIGWEWSFSIPISHSKPTE